VTYLTYPRPGGENERCRREATEPKASGGWCVHWSAMAGFTTRLLHCYLWTVQLGWKILCSSDICSGLLTGEIKVLKEKIEKLKKSKALAMTAWSRWLQDSRSRSPWTLFLQQRNPCFPLAKYKKIYFYLTSTTKFSTTRQHIFGPSSPAGQGRSACTLQKPESGDARTDPSSDEEPAVASGTQCVTPNALSASTAAWTAFPFRLIFRPHLHTAHRKIFHPSLPRPCFRRRIGHGEDESFFFSYVLLLRCSCMYRFLARLYAQCEARLVHSLFL
jgi:hypothetical protein